MSGAVTLDEGEVSRLTELAALFEFADRTEGIQGTAKAMRQDLVRSKTLWDLQFMIDSQIDVWKQLLWDDINAAALEEETKAFQKIIKGMDKAVREWDVYAGIDSVIKNFLVSVPAVSELKSPAMRQRHWDKLMQITEATIAVSDGKFDPAFCLAVPFISCPSCSSPSSWG